MALRALRDGEPLTMLTYMAYSEWRVEPDESEQEMTETVPDARSFVRRCPWQRAWVEKDLLRYGRLYCLEIDQALVRGFNPDLQLEVLSTLSNDDRPCEFVFRDANLTPENMQMLNAKKSANQLRGGVLPWEYHTGHLYAAMKSVIEAELGEGGERILREALSEFARCYGEQAPQVILSYQAFDSDCLPD